jgi:phosphohistidine phosphatase SixA
MAVVDITTTRQPAGRPLRPVPARPSGTSAPERVVMLIRHAEKPLPSGPAYGISPVGRPDKRSLTVDGWQRAGALVELFAPARGRPPAGLWRPDAVYASAARNGRSRRSIETVEPLARQLGITVVDRYAPGDEAKLVGELVARPGATLVSWHHKSLNAIIDNLGDITPAPPRHWPRDRYDMVWVFVGEAGGWRFAQVPQLLLPGDQPVPIAA